MDSPRKMALRLSSYNIVVPSNKDKWVVYNGLSDSIITIDDELKTIIDSQSWEKLSSEYLGALAKLGIITTSSYQTEYNSFIFKHRAKVYSPLECEFTVRITNDCNLKCHGCQSAINEKSHVISSTTTEKVLNSIKTQSLAIGAKVVNIRLIGGEIFLYPDLILKILRELKQWGSENNIEVKSALITNGTLITQDLVNRFAPLIDVINITLEGSPRIHNKLRPYKDGSGTFRDIISCIKLFSETEYPIFSLVRLHITPDTFNTLDDLIKILRNEKFHLIPRINILPIGRLESYNICQMFAPLCVQDIYSDLVLKSMKLLKKAGFRILPKPLPTYRNLPCPLLSAYAIFFDYDENCYNCLRMVGNDQNKAAYFDAHGNFVRDPIFTYDFTVREAADNIECTKCNFQTLCNSGCAYRVWLKNKSYKGHNCGGIQEITRKKLQLYVEFEDK